MIRNKFRTWNNVRWETDEGVQAILTEGRRSSSQSVHSTEHLPSPFLLWTPCLALYLVTLTPSIPVPSLWECLSWITRAMWGGGYWGIPFPWPWVLECCGGIPLASVPNWNFVFLSCGGKCYMVKFKNSGIVSIVSMGLMWCWPRWCCTPSVPILQWWNAEVGNWLHLQQAVSKPPHCPKGDVTLSLKVNPEKWPR